MSGHNKWSSIKHRKAAQDSKRQAVFNKLIRELVVAAREGGGDVKNNATLEALVDKCRLAAMPKETMERAIARGAGASSGENYERVSYEGRGPAGTAMIIDCLTDNRNRTVADVRHLFSKHGGSLGENGSVAWQFERKGVLTVEAAGHSEDDLLEACAEAGADDFKFDGEAAEIYCEVPSLQSVKQWFAGQSGYAVKGADIAMVPKDTVEVTDENEAKRLLKLIDALEENDDIQNVFSNWSMNDELIERVAG
jgi:YebC/PmpR family DNA-binding regulatory protein